MFKVIVFVPACGVLRWESGFQKKLDFLLPDIIIIGLHYIEETKIINRNANSQQFQQILIGLVFSKWA